MFIVYFRSDDARTIEEVMITDSLSYEVLNHPRYIHSLYVGDLPKSVIQMVNELPKNVIFPKNIVMDHLRLMGEQYEPE
jgi:hypothetical protein